MISALLPLLSRPQLQHLVPILLMHLCDDYRSPLVLNHNLLLGAISTVANLMLYPIIRPTLDLEEPRISAVVPLPLAAPFL